MKLTFNADDLGMSEQSDQGILAAARENLIESASVSVVNGLDLEKIGFFRKQQGFESLSLGLHVNLSEGLPISSRNVFGQENLGMGFRSSVELLVREEDIVSEALCEEMCAQIDRFIFLFGVGPRHLDCHQHFAYLSPKAFNALADVSKHFGIPIRSPTPFINEHRLAKFIRSVEKRFDLKVPFSAAEQASQLSEIYYSKLPVTRTDDCHLGFPHHMIENEGSSQFQTVEVICHPRVDPIESTIREIENLRDCRRRFKISHTEF